MDTNKLKKDNENFLLECERWWIFALMICVGGFFGGYTYCARGGVFCNAQTANFMLFGMAVGKADWSTAVYYVIPMISYLGGTVISELIPKSVKKISHIRWDTFFVLFEIIVVLIIGIIPQTAPVQICHIMINFICAMQYNTFRNAENIPAATVFCSNHARQMGIYLVKGLKHREDKKLIRRSFFHAGMIFSFIVGAFLATICCKYFGTRSIWFAEILLVITFADLLYADLVKEKGLLDKVPKGH